MTKRFVRVRIFKLSRLVQMRLGRFQLHHTQAFSHGRVIGLQARDFIQLRECRIVILLLLQSVTERKVGLGIIGLQFQRLPDECFGAISADLA